MTLFFNTFIAESKIPEEPVRLARLDWVVLSDEWRIVRGFQFHIDPTDWGMTEDGALIESGDTFNRLAVMGHPINKVLEKFIYDHDQCETAITMDCDRCFAILVYEAQKAGLRAQTRISDRRSLGEYTDESLDLKANIQPLIDFFVKKGENGFYEFNPVQTV